MRDLDSRVITLPMKEVATEKLAKDRLIGVLVDLPLYRKVIGAAEKEKRSVSQFVRLVLEKALAK